MNWWEETNTSADPPSNFNFDTLREMLNRLKQPQPTTVTVAFVQQICQRASQLGWKLERTQQGPLHQFTFVSPDQQRRVPGRPMATEQQALASLAVFLNDYHFLDS